MYKKIFKNFELFFFILIIIIFSFTFNFYYANIGVFPIDTFLHYDSAYRILNNEYPIRDYWAVTSIFVDFLAALTFKVGGVNWLSHIIHSSLFNVFISLLTFFFFLKIDLEKKYAFFYTLLFSILAYPPSGTPFVDHHAAFFMLAGAYLSIIAIKKKNIKYWCIAPFLFFFSFLSKQVPLAYFAIFFIPIILFYCITQKNFKPLITCIISTIIILTIFLSCLFILKIEFKDFLTQYILYPQSIGTSRSINLPNINLNTFFNNYKFILIPYVAFLYINFAYIEKKKIKLKNENLCILLMMTNLIFSLILHQTLTKNQIFIYFLIPVLAGFFHSRLTSIELKKNLILILMITLFTITTTYKYHTRYNESRKFHDLENVNFNNYIEASEIDISLKRLKWTTKLFEKNLNKEINIIKSTIKKLEQDNDNIILITNYSFLSAITNKKLFSPSKYYTADGVAYPLKGNKYYDYYRNFFISIIKKNNIKKIYLLKNEKINENTVTDYLDKSCLETLEDQHIKYFLISKNCYN